MPSPIALPPHTEHLVEVLPGVRVFVRAYGPPRAPAVLFHHGTPSSNAALPGGWAGLPDDIRLVSFDRPGYGRSDDQPGRTVADAARWCAAIADALGIDRFAVTGTSGGGPHAAATAAVLGERVTRVCVDVGLGPVGHPGFDELHDMVPETAEEVGHARAGYADLRRFVESLHEREDPLGAWMDRLPPSDVEVLSRPDVQVEEAFEAAEVAAGGIEGWLEDDLAFFARPWGIRLRDITAEVLLMYGGADVLVPAHHGSAYLDAIGHGRLVVLPGKGHWLRDSEAAALAWLTGRTEQVPGAARG